MIKEIIAVHDEENERPIPTLWRTTFTEIVRSFVAKDYKVAADINGLISISDEISKQIHDYIRDYDEVLMELPEESWQTSVCIWMGSRWDVLIDLWTIGEGCSDLVLKANVSQVGDNYEFEVEMVYVP
jgi:hypothetical protein